MISKGSRKLLNRKEDGEERIGNKIEPNGIFISPHRFFISLWPASYYPLLLLCFSSDTFFLIFSLTILYLPYPPQPICFIFCSVLQLYTTLPPIIGGFFLHSVIASILSLKFPAYTSSSFCLIPISHYRGFFRSSSCFPFFPVSFPFSRMSAMLC